MLLKQWFSTRVILPPARGHLTTPEDIFDSHNWGMLLASRE